MTIISQHYQRKLQKTQWAELALAVSVVFYRVYEMGLDECGPFSAIKQLQLCNDTEMLTEIH